MSILDSIDRLAVYEALRELDKRGWSPNRTPTHLWLEVGRKLYPPKVVIETASKGELGRYDLTSYQATSHLRSLGFRTVSVKDSEEANP